MPRSTGRQAVLRAGLVDVLRGRFDHGTVVLTAGAGFGKTTTLRQAVAENELAPAGTDVWLTCRPRHRVASQLANDLAVAIDPGLSAERADHPEATVDDALLHAAQRWPLGVALLFDDVHVLGASEGSRLLRHLVLHRPPPVHVVLAGRTPLDWLPSLRAAGPVLELHEHQLRFDDAEVAALAQARGVTTEALAALGGWPALVDLAATFGVAGAADFVEEEVLARIDRDDRQDLAAIALVGGGSRDVSSAAAGHNVDPAALSARLPMTTIDPDGGIQVHSLWTDLLRDELDPPTSAAICRRVAQHVLAAGDVERAAALFADAGDWDGFEATVAETWRRGYIGKPLDGLAAWLERLPADRHDGPAGLLLRGAAARIQDSFGDRARDLLEAAVLACRRAGSVPGELAALGEYGYVCRARGELDRLVPVLERLVELGQGGSPAARPFVHVTEAAMLDLQGDDAGVLAALAPISEGDLSREWSVAVAYLRLMAASRVGDGALVEQAAEACVRNAGRGSVHDRFTPALTSWYLDRPQEALRSLPELTADPSLSRVDQAVLGARCSIVEAMAGRLDRARGALASATTATLGSVQPALFADLTIAEATIAAASGDDASAAALLRTLPLAPAAGPTDRWLRTNLAVGYVLLPDARADIDAAPLGSALGARRDAGRVAAAIREGADPPPPEAWPAPDALLCALPLSWTARLAAWAEHHGSPVGAALADRMVAVHGDRGRAALRGLAGSDGLPTGDAQAARSLLAATSVEPTATLSLDLLGAATLRRDGAAIDHPDWDRDLVRALLALLVLRGPQPRAVVAALLWPDADPQAAAHNLRTHLNLLLGVLEPGRLSGEATFVIRPQGEDLSVAGPPHLTVDVHRFAAALDEASRTGDPGHLDRALALWHGTPLADLPDLPWVADERADLEHRFVAAAHEDGTAQLAAGRPGRAVARAIDALQVDPWSEAAYQLLIAGYAADGDRAAARRALQRCLAMLEELGVPAAPDTELLARQLSR